MPSSSTSSLLNSEKGRLRRLKSPPLQILHRYSTQGRFPLSPRSYPRAIVLLFLCLFSGSSMADFRSRSCTDGRSQIEPYGTLGPPLPSHDLRSYSTSHGSSYCGKDAKPNKGAIVPSFKGGWLSDPEIQRKKRVAGYKAYLVEGKVKGSFRKSFRWMKDKCSQAVYGWR